MAKQFDSFSDDHTQFVAEQHIIFVGSAAQDGRVNISPKGMDSVRIVGPNRLMWRNLTGSGNETAGHLRKVNRMTVMWCSFGKRPLILRAYGTATCLHARDEGFDALNADFPPSPGARQIYDMAVDLVQTSCGYAVPFMEFQEDRNVLRDWAENKGHDGIRDYWRDRNQKTIDGLPTGIVAE